MTTRKRKNKIMEKIKEIEVSGRIYGAGEKLEIFALNSHNNQTVSWCTIYGKNGSGKTTLSKALWNYSHPDDESLETDSPQTSFNLESNISPENCYVFNEDFINRRVRFNQDNLGAIVSLGSQGDAQDKIKENEDALEAKQKEIDTLKWTIDGSKSENRKQDNSSPLTKQSEEAKKIYSAHSKAMIAGLVILRGYAATNKMQVSACQTFKECILKVL